MGERNVVEHETQKTCPDGHAFRVRGEGQGEGGGEHVKHAQTGMFFVFEGKGRVREMANM